MYNISHIAAHEPSRLPAIQQELVLKKMELDKQFSEFLGENEWTMGENVDTPIWREYKDGLRQYSEVTKTLVQIEYYLKRA